MSRPSQRTQDLEHLRLLSIFHYVVGALIGLFSLIPLIHFAVGLMMMSAPAADPGLSGEEAAMIMGMGLFFAVLAGVFILCGLAFAGCMIVAGRKLTRQESYTFCLVMAGLSCMFMPFGTILGVFTLIVLLRPSVKELFENAAAESTAAGNTSDTTLQAIS